MESIECEGEAEFHSVTHINCKQESEGLDLDEQVNSNPSSNSLMVSKVTQQSNGALISIFIYTTETVRTVCAIAFLPKSVHVILNK